jgi:RNA polymerase sigma-70 factor (ECF subfamily)
LRRPVRTDDELIALCRRRDAGAWEELIRRYQPAMLRLAFQFTGDEEEARDLAQEIFVRLYRTLDRYDPQRSFRVWIYSLARNLCIDHYRRRRRDRNAVRSPGEEIASPGEAPDQRLLRRERRESLLRALDTLGSASREAIVMKDLQDLTVQEIASILGIPAGTVKSRVWRARCELERALLRARPRSAGGGT